MLHKPRNKQYREGRGEKRGGSGNLHCTELYMLHGASGKAHTVIKEAAGLSETREEEGKNLNG